MNHKLDPVTGPYQNIFQAYFGNLDSAARGYEPAYKAMARGNLEVMGLVSRRARAYMELPARLASCRTPQELLNEQTHFWQTAYQNYTESARTMMTLWSSVLPFGGLLEQGMPKPVRDYISFPEASEPPAKPSQSEERRAA